VAGEYVLVTVADDGTGIDEETQARIFDPFFTTKDRDSGTGLGLSLAQGVIRQSGGAIEVSSALGSGTTFRILLPVASVG
jgi:two-component system cell cycle sensor histidine kinase/response regulator CckA